MKHNLQINKSKQKVISLNKEIGGEKWAPILKRYQNRLELSLTVLDR